ncbi:MAG: DUF547 domain-containing protein [Deltaproteobacteria bacterium]|nr:DUF547 domain-containing protein [Deltaproteobacteria bacterium]
MTLMWGVLPFRAVTAQDIFSAKSYRVKGSGETAAPKPEPAKVQTPSMGLPSSIGQLPEGTHVFVPSAPEYVYHEVANPQPVAVPKGPPPVYVNHEVFGKILEKFVSKSGWVNYRDLKRDKEAQESLDAYVNDLTALNPSTLTDPQDKLTAWLNLYNATILRDILKVYPVENLLKIPNFFGKPRFKVGDKTYSILDVEEQIFRQELQEPRTVFARVNGASSSPRLMREAYDPRKIDRQLEERTMAFFKDPANMHYDIPRKTMLLNATVAFYEKDFLDLRGFLANYLSGMAPNYYLSYLGYDWKLNDEKLH